LEASWRDRVEVEGVEVDVAEEVAAAAASSAAAAVFKSASSEMSLFVFGWCFFGCTG